MQYDWSVGTRTLMSVAEFEKLPDDGNLHELDEGELIVMPPMVSVPGTAVANGCQLTSIASWAPPTHAEAFCTNIAAAMDDIEHNSKPM